MAKSEIKHLCSSTFYNSILDVKKDKEDYRVLRQLLSVFISPYNKIQSDFQKKYTFNSKSLIRFKKLYQRNIPKFHGIK